MTKQHDENSALKTMTENRQFSLAH